MSGRGMTLTDRRQIALGAVRSEIRRGGGDPLAASAAYAWRVLDNIARKDAALIAARFYLECSQYQVELFFRDWRRWQKRRAQ